MAPLQEGIEEQENYKTVGEGFGLLAASEIIVFGYWRNVSNAASISG